MSDQLPDIAIGTLTFDQFQSWSRKTAVYSNLGKNYIYPVLGLVSEAGEVADRVKRIDRDDGNIVSEGKINEVASELGDVLWYVSQVATEFGLSLSEIAAGNLSKLYDRMEHGSLKGYGKR